MPYKDPQIAKEKARERKKRWTEKNKPHFIHNLEKGKNEKGQFIGHKAAGRILDGVTHDELVWRNNENNENN